MSYLGFRPSCCDEMGHGARDGLVGLIKVTDRVVVDSRLSGLGRGDVQTGRVEVAERLRLSGGGSSLGKASVVELVGQGRVEHKVRYGLCLGVKRLSCA